VISARSVLMQRRDGLLLPSVLWNDIA